MANATNSLVGTIGNRLGSAKVERVSYPSNLNLNTEAPDLHNLLVVGLDGLEPTTSVLSGPRSNRLSYRPTGGATNRQG